MYEKFYGIKEKPFNLTPDPRFIYFTEKHCEALANLVYGIRERKGFLVLSGEVGTGKSTLVSALLNTLERTGVLSAFIFNPILSSTEFFEYLLADLNLKCDAQSKSQSLIKLNSLLLERYRSGQITVLIVDEAQNLSAEILEEIRLLTNLETATEKLLQIVLVGQPELSLKLNSPELRQAVAVDIDHDGWTDVIGLGAEGTGAVFLHNDGERLVHVPSGLGPATLSLRC